MKHDEIDMAAVRRWAEYLNSLNDLDGRLMSALCNSRLPANEAVREHPTVQCCDGQVGLLGIINGFLGADDYGMGPLAAIFDDDSGRLLRFEATKGFGLPQHVKAPKRVIQLRHYADRLPVRDTLIDTLRDLAVELRAVKYGRDARQK